MRTAKKVLSLLLTLAMVLGMFCVPAAAASAGTITLSLVFAADKNGNTEIDSLDAAGDFYALVNFSGAVTSNPIGNYNIFVKYPNTITGSSVVKKAGLAEPTYKQNGQIASAGFSDNEGVYDEEGENPATEGTLFVIKCTANAAIDDLASSIYFLEQAETQSGTAVAKIKDIDGGEYALAGIPMELGELTLDPASVTVNGSLATDAVTAAPTVSSAGGSAISLDSVDITVTKNEITYDWYDNGVITVPNDAVAGDYTVTAEANASDLLGSATATLTVARAASTPASTAPQAATVALPTAADNKDAELPLTAKDQFGDAMTSGVDYALKSQIEGVSIDGSTAKVSLAAKSNTFPVTVAYTATANGVTVESSFQITREASAVVPRTIVIGVDQETLVIPTDDTSVTATFTATAQDQYGDNLAPTVTAWEITAGKVASVDIEGGTITVTKDAANDIPDSKTMTVTATIGGEAYTKDVTVARAASVPTTIAISGGPSDTILIPANGEADAAVDAFAATVKDQYGKKLDSAQVNWAISDIKIDGASVTADGITLDAVSNAAKAQIARGKTATVTVTAISADDTSLSETATFTVARAASVAKTIQITDEAGNAVSGTDIIGIPGSKQYAAPVYDQYGDEMASATLTLGSTAGFELSGSTVSVAADTQDEASVTLTASYDTKEETLTIQARSVSFDWPVAVEGGIAYGDSRQSAFGESWKDTAKATAYIEGVPTELNGKFTIVDDEGLIPAGDAQTITVKFEITDDAATAGGYASFSAAKSYTVKVAKAALTVTANDKTIVYGDAAANDGVVYSGFVNNETESVLGGTLAYAYGSYAAGSDKGEYAITPSGLTSDNYDITFVDGKLTVEPKTVSITWGETTAFTYNGEEQKPTAAVGGAYGDDALEAAVSGAQKNAGDTAYTATVTGLTGDKAANYQLPDTGLTQEFTIGKAPLTVSGVSVSTKEYDGTTNATGGGITLTGMIGDEQPAAQGTFAWDAADAGTKGFTVTEIALTDDAVNANYELAETEKSGTNEDGITKADVALANDAPAAQILRSKSTVAESQTKTIPLGSLIAYAAQDGMQSGDVTYAVKTYGSALTAATAVISGSNLTVTLTKDQSLDADAVDKLEITISSKNFADQTATLNFKFMAKKDISAEIEFTDITRTYDGTSDYAVAASYSGAAELTYQFEGTTLGGAVYSSADKPTEAGTYTVTASYEDEVETADGLPGSIGTATATLTIDPKEAELVWDGYETREYDGAASNVTATVGNLVSGDECTVTVGGGDAVDANSEPYKATATELSNKNYALPSAVDQEYTITPKTVTVTGVTVEGKTYDGTPAVTGTPEIAVDVTLADAAVSADVAWTSANAGTNTVALTNVKLEGNKAGNYTIGETATLTVDATIDKAALTVTAKAATTGYGLAAANEGVEYDGFVNGETESVLKGSLAYKYLASDETAYKAGSDVGAYDIVPYGYTEENYAITYEKGTLTVSPRPITFTWSSAATFTYNGEDQGPTAAITNKYGSDDVTAIVTGIGKDAGSYTAEVSALDGAKKDNYAIPADAETKEYAITEIEVTISGIEAVWDSETKSVKLSGGKVEGALEGDEVTVDFANCEPAVETGACGSNVPVTLTNAPALSGAAAMNYKLKEGGYNAVTVNIPQPGVEVSTDMGDNATDHSAVNYDDATVKGAVDQVEGTELDTTNSENKDAIEQAMNGVAAKSETAAAGSGVDLSDLPALAGDTSSPIIAVVPTLTVTTTAVQTAEDDAAKVESVTVSVAVTAQTFATTENAYNSGMKTEGDDVNAKAVGTEQVTLTSAVTLTIPSPFASSVTTVYVTQTVNGKKVETAVAVSSGAIPVSATGGIEKGGSEIELSTVSASKYAIGSDGYTTMQDAVDVVPNNGTITVKQDASDNATVSRELVFTLDTSGAAYSGKISAGSGYELKNESGVYTVTKKTSTGTGGGGVSTTASITAAAASNGSVTLSKTSAKAGETVTITPKANEGCKLASITVKDSKGNVLPTTRNADGTYSFTMPASGASPSRRSSSRRLPRRGSSTFPLTATMPTRSIGRLTTASPRAPARPPSRRTRPAPAPRRSRSSIVRRASPRSS